MSEFRADQNRRSVDDPDLYQPPSVRRLGTLAELTRGGVVGPDDGLGGAGDEGSV